MVRKRGRPRKIESKKATHVIAIRVSEDEYERLKAASDRQKVSVARVIKNHLWQFLDD